MDNITSDPLIGRAISQYEVVARIGGGGMGVVYKATDLKLGRAVALKFLPPQWSHDDGAKQRFLREAQAASATNHRNICIIHDIAQTDDGQLFIVMAYYEGETLKQKLEAGPLPVAEALEIAAEIAEGLAKAHAQGVVHRDVKPGNLMITDDGVKVLDFGLAKFADSLQLTMAGSTVGTVAYMSPEQARGEEADARSDVWALGVVLYEMLTGRVPFKGAYPEATFHAIKNEPVPPLSGADREIPPALEMLVLRALEKGPERRYQSAREVARDLRLLQGRTVPLDLRTEQLPPLPQVPPGPAAFDSAQARQAGPHGGLRERLRRAVTPARAIAAVVAVAVAVAGAYAWMTRPVVRIPVAIAPVANHTGEPELDSYRMALTQSLVDEVSDSPNIRVVPYPRLLEIVRRFIGAGDVSSSEAIQAIATESGASFVVIPSLEYRNATWMAQVQIRNVETGTVTKSYETDATASSLPKDTVLHQMPLLAEKIQAHFKANGPGRSYGSRPASARFRNLDAVKAFEEGLRAYQDLEYGRATDGFRRAVLLDDQQALAHAWIARMLLLLYRGNESVGSSQRARQLVNAETPKADGIFIEAVLAETLGDVVTAEARYKQLAAAEPDDAAARAELAEFLRRRDRNQQAAETYHEVLRLDAGDAWAHAQLCQLYTRLGDYPLAETEANAALARYRPVGNRSGEAQALLCLGEAQRNQAGPRLPEARRNIAAARGIFESLDLPYNLSRVSQYQGVVEFADGNFYDAARFFQDAAERSAAVGNRSTEGLSLMNLGVTERQLGQRAKAIMYLRQSRDIFEQIGVERRAAEAEMNAAGLQIEYGLDEAEAVRRLVNARVTLQKLGYVDFQVGAMDLEAASLRHAGRLGDARRQLIAALSIAREKQLSHETDAIIVSIAQTDLLLNDYETARTSLEEIAVKDGTSKLDAQIALGTVYARMGHFDVARKHLEAALAAIDAGQNTQYTPAIHTALGELAYQTGTLMEARAHFEKAAALWTDDLPDAASVDARSFLGLLDGLARKDRSALGKLQSAVAQAKRMGRLDLETRCRLRLGQLEVTEGRSREALATLDQISLEGGPTVGRELEALVHHWRGRALLAAGDWARATSEAALARKLLMELQASLPAASRDRFALRADIRRMREEL